ncbi:hypothetical protein CEXT_276711 [Caerostris extrusa]|uniref:Uncharacterized protein n=1 Tax=Caerostris extrusa TaxID=172846 RepID=A0AAV4QMP6_CAEEX|nr:hypothetical protein CEXT_276711 [Caerostris extrusa]
MGHQDCGSSKLMTTLEWDTKAVDHLREDKRNGAFLRISGQHKNYYNFLEHQKRFVRLLNTFQNCNA